VTDRSPLEVTLSKTSYVTVRFDGGPRAGEKRELAGEPRRRFGAGTSTPGHYEWRWDRDDNGVRQRSGVYVWRGATGDDLVEPKTGDEASALLERADGNVSTKDGASISPVPDLTGEAAQSTLDDVHSQLSELEAEREAQSPADPDTRADGERKPHSGDEASKEANEQSAKAPTAKPTSSTAARKPAVK
jgi:hypothetical protein